MATEFPSSSTRNTRSTCPSSSSGTCSPATTTTTLKRRFAKALPHTFEQLKMGLDRTLETQLPRTGKQKELLKAEVEKVVLHTTTYVETVEDQRALFQAWKARESLQPMPML